MGKHPFDAQDSDIQSEVYNDSSDLVLPRNRYDPTDPMPHTQPCQSTQCSQLISFLRFIRVHLFSLIRSLMHNELRSMRLEISRRMDRALNFSAS